MKLRSEECHSSNSTQSQNESLEADQQIMSQHVQVQKIQSQPVGERFIFDLKNCRKKFQAEKSLRQAQIDQNRKNKRHDLIARKRKIVPGQDCTNTQIKEFQVEQKNLDTQQYHESVRGPQRQVQYSEVSRISQSLKSSDETIWNQALTEMDDYLRNEKDEHLVQIKIFDIIETGVLQYLVNLMANTPDTLTKVKITQIVINLALAERREMHKLMNSGLINLLYEEILQSTDLRVVINCIIIFTNICQTRREFSDRVIKQFPKLFGVIHDRFINTDLCSNSLKNETVFLISSVLRYQNSIVVDTFIQSLIPVLHILAKNLRSFDFSSPLNFQDQNSFPEKPFLSYEAEVYLAETIKQMCVLHDMKLRFFEKESIVFNKTGSKEMSFNIKPTSYKDPLMEQYPQQKLDEVINQYSLFDQLMRILDHQMPQTQQNTPLLSETWHLVGNLSCEIHSESNVKAFVDLNSQYNLINIIHRQLSTYRNSPLVIKQCLFALSNVIADGSAYLKQVLDLNLISILVEIWHQVLSQQKQQNQNDFILMDIKNELLFCVGNCNLAVNDSLLFASLQMLNEAFVKQEGIIIMYQGLDFKNYPNSSDNLKVALDSVYRFMKTFKRVVNHKTQEVQQDFGPQYYDKILLEFETRFDGLDHLEHCQYHADIKVYKMAQKVINNFFELESDSDPLIKLLNDLKMQKQNQARQPREIVRFQEPDTTKLSLGNCPEDDN